MVRKDQVQFMVEQLERDYKAFSTLPRRTYLATSDKAEVRQSLKASLDRAQKMLEELGQPSTGRSAELMNLQSKLILWAEMCAADLKEPVPR